MAPKVPQMWTVLLLPRSGDLGVTRRPLGGTTSHPGSHSLLTAPLRQVSSWVVTPSLPLDRGTLSPLGLF